MTSISAEHEKRAEKPYISITPPGGWVAIDLAEIWAYRGMVWQLTLRDIKKRYKQSALGPTWVVLLPLVSAGIFSVIFGALAGLPSGEIPYPVFVYTGMLIWGLFARAFTQTCNSIAINANLITKVYFPRLIGPIAGVAGSMLDLLLGLFVLTVMLLVTGIAPDWHIIYAPLCVVFAMLAAMSIGIWIAALSVKFRDIRFSATFLTQLMMWLTPVAYSSELVFGNERIPADWQPWAETAFQLNPMFVVVEGFRWSILGHPYGQPTVITAISVALTLALLWAGMLYFRRVDSTVADII